MFYAVKVGIKPGIYLTWDECKKQVTNYSGAIFKKFATRKEAEEFIFGKFSNPSNSNKSNEVITKKKLTRENEEKLQLWTDGSAKLGVNAGFGYVVVNGDDVYERYGNINKPPFSAPQAEVIAISKGINFIRKYFIDEDATSNESQPDFDVYCDSLYVVNTLTIWGPQRLKRKADWNQYEYHSILKPLTQWIMDYEGTINIYHVNSHTGLKYNELADQLAEEGRLST